MPKPQNSQEDPTPVGSAGFNPEADSEAGDAARAELLQAKREAAAAAGTGRTPPPAASKGRPRKKPVHEDAEFIAAAQDLRRKSAQELRQLADWFKNGGRGTPPASLLPTLTPNDDTHPRIGKESLKWPGQRFVWVPPREASDADPAADSKILEMESEGFAVVTYEKVASERPELAANITKFGLTGPVKRQYGYLMHIPHAAAALREFAASPTGGLTPEDFYYAGLNQAVQQANQEVGGVAMRLRRDDDMGTQMGYGE